MGDDPSRGPMMTRVCWQLVEILSLMLHSDERQAVRGDLAESGETGSQALSDVLGLAFRRQAAVVRQNVAHYIQRDFFFLGLSSSVWNCRLIRLIDGKWSQKM
jgi:hypothetical protein